MSTETKTVKGTELRVGMYIEIGFNTHMITDLSPVRIFTNHGLHTQRNKTLVTILNGEDTVSIIVENDKDYTVVI